MMEFIHVTDNTQFAYSPTRGAIGEWWRGRDKWMFVGWSHDGQIHSADQAREVLKAHLEQYGDL